MVSSVVRLTFTHILTRPLVDVVLENPPPGQSTTYDLVANVTHESTAGTTRDKENTVWKVHLRAPPIASSSGVEKDGVDGGEEGQGDRSMIYPFSTSSHHTLYCAIVDLGEAQSVTSQWQLMTCSCNIPRASQTRSYHLLRDQNPKSRNQGNSDHYAKPGFN